MIEIFSGILIFLFTGCVSLIVYIFSNQTRRINKLENVQQECPVSRIYTILGTVQTDISWIKKSLKNNK